VTLISEIKGFILVNPIFDTFLFSLTVLKKCSPVYFGEPSFFKENDFLKYCPEYFLS
jgi:hypothetical protein